MLATNMLFNPMSAFTYPVQKRNTVADWMFYDVGGLTAAEFTMLSREINREGSILVVEPAGQGDGIGIQKFETFETFRAEPGDLLQHFSIAGVGSSDVGAAALARTLANHLDEPVGAIVAGYGVADLLSEAMGGWFFFGAQNRALEIYEQWNETMPLGSPGTSKSEQSRTNQLRGSELSPDTKTLVRLLRESEREVKTILGHSKGCLSMSYALQSLASLEDKSSFDRAKDIDIITTGAVLAFPRGLNGVRQYLGGIDWFGGLNSRGKTAYFEVAGAWHHLNTNVPFHMDLKAVLSGTFDSNPKTIYASLHNLS